MIRTQNSAITSHKEGLLIVGHGTRDVRGTDEFHRTVRRVQQRSPGLAVQPCFLELDRPSIMEGAMRLAEQGVRQIIALPMMLLAGGHVKCDIPAALDEAAEAMVDRFGPVSLRQTAHLGDHAKMVELSTKRHQEAIAKADGNSYAPVPLDDTLLLMVGRGSRDSGVIDQMRQFVGRRCQQTQAPHTQTCYMAMAQPSLESMLRQIEDARFRRIVVQPHLLFHGRLLSTLSDRVKRAAADRPGQQWLVTRHLGPDPLLVDVIIDLARG